MKADSNKFILKSLRFIGNLSTGHLKDEGTIVDFLDIIMALSL